MISSNSYSTQWFEFFSYEIGEGRTAREVEFISACAGLPDFHRVLDVCCGLGRHARALASRGYLVTGVERDPSAVTRARELAAGPRYIEADIRDFRADPGAFDIAIVMFAEFRLL